MKRLLLPLLLPALLCAGAYAQSDPGNTARTTTSGDEQIITFRFVPGEDMFYIPWEGNNIQLEALYAIVDQYSADITSGVMPVYVDSYSASASSAERNRELAFTRANRVKSELITNKGLVEENFITKNYTTAYTGSDGTIYKDMVVVTLRIPAAEAKPDDSARLEQERREREAAERARREQAERDRAERERTDQERAAREQAERERNAAEQAERERLAALEAANAKPYCFAVRTNLLYDAFLVPTLGVEWRANSNLAVKLDGSYSFWGDEHGKVQKVWLVSPEVRWYMLENKRFYVGVSGNVGEYNIYKGMLGGLFSGEVGYQGKLWGAGLTVGYQLYLSRSFSLDFNLGLGYTRLEYDSFTISNDTRVYKERDKSRNFWGPTQAGVSLVWTIGGNK